jgi:hypothetical protein
VSDGSDSAAGSPQVMNSIVRNREYVSYPAESSDKVGAH